MYVRDSFDRFLRGGSDSVSVADLSVRGWVVGLFAFFVAGVESEHVIVARPYVHIFSGADK